MRVCKNRTWLAVAMIWSIDASVYYAFAIIWPQMVQVLYADGRHIWAGWASCVVTGGITLGLILGGLVKKKIHWILRICFFIGSTLLACKFTSSKQG
jgi:predicted MFS family arabinose efflux permease